MAYHAMHRRAQLAESRAAKAEKALTQLTSIHVWLYEDKGRPSERPIERGQLPGADPGPG